MAFITRSTEAIYQGLVFSIVRDVIEDDVGKQFVRDVVEHSGGAGGLVLFPDQRLAFVRQYRHPARAFLLEIPAGKIDAGETPEICARREIEEELGYRAGKIEKLAEFYSTPGFCAEKLYIFLATELTATQQKLDHDEAVEIVFHTLEEAKLLIAQGEIVDAKTIIAVQLLAQKLAATAQ